MTPDHPAEADDRVNRWPISQQADAFRTNHHRAFRLLLSMIFSENRCPTIGLWSGATLADRAHAWAIAGFGASRGAPVWNALVRAPDQQNFSWAGLMT